MSDSRLVAAARARVVDRHPYNRTRLPSLDWLDRVAPAASAQELGGWPDLVDDHTRRLTALEDELGAVARS